MTVGYLAVSILCVFAAKRRTCERLICLAWLLLGTIFFLLCANKQLDLQTLFKEWFNSFVMAYGWSSQRRVIIGGSLAGASAIIAVMYAIVVRRLPRGAKNLRRALVCLGCLLVGLLLQYLPLGSVSGILGFSIFGASDGVWQFDLIELLEVVFLIRVGLRALSEIRNSELRN